MTPATPTPPTGGEAERLDGLREALAPFADCCHNHFHDRSVLDRLPDDASVLCLVREGKLSPTGISVGDLRRATAAFAAASLVPAEACKGLSFLQKILNREPVKLNNDVAPGDVIKITLDSIDLGYRTHPQNGRASLLAVMLDWIVQQWAAAEVERGTLRRQVAEVQTIGPCLWGRYPKTGIWKQIDDGGHTEEEVAAFEETYAAAGWTDLRRTNPFLDRRVATAEAERDALAAMAGEALAENCRLSAVAEERFADLRLMRAGPREGGFEFELSGTPVVYLAEYLAQFLGHRGEGLPSNYTETEVHHRELGWLTLTLQRRSGLTPHQKAVAAEAREAAATARATEAEARASRAETDAESLRIAIMVLEGSGHGGGRFAVRNWFRKGRVGLIPWETGACFKPWADSVGIVNDGGFMRLARSALSPADPSQSAEGAGQPKEPTP